MLSSFFKITSVNDKGPLCCESRSGHTLTSLSRKRDMAVGVSERLLERLSAGLISCFDSQRFSLPLTEVTYFGLEKLS
jgi:hypothetical protein